MPHHAITDWDDAYANAPNIARSERWPEAWVQQARAFREEMTAAGRAELMIRYGARDRECLDLFHPEGRPRGLVVIIHGGFWMSTDRSFWSHLAAGAVARGYAVALPSYTLCPAARLYEIAREAALAIATVAAHIEGPIVLAGHSAGGQLATRMVTTTSPLETAVRNRIAHILSISGLHDLRPLLRTRMNETLKIDAAEAIEESPALLEPVAGVRLTCWAGAAERSEFIRQNALLANIWKGLGASTIAVEEPDRHHYDVTEGLADPDHPLCNALLAF